MCLCGLTQTFQYDLILKNWSICVISQTFFNLYYLYECIDQFKVNV